MKIRRVSAAVLVRSERRPSTSLVSQRERVVRAFVDALLGGDHPTAQRLCAPDVRMHAKDPDSGVGVVVVGFAALLELTRRRAAAMGTLRRYEVLGMLSGEDRVACIFSPMTGPDGTLLGIQRLSVYTVADGYITHVHAFQGSAT